MLPPGQTKIDEFQCAGFSFSEHHIGRFHITVDNAGLMGMTECFG